jgi:hypothetical protein
LKYKDPGCPTISCFIGEHKKALLDLGASVNLLPYSIFQSLNLGELKPTSITLLLVDRSVKVPRGIVEVVLVQVDKFIYHVDFIVLETQPLILGRSFLTTSNALINCRNGLMKLSFGNMTLCYLSRFFLFFFSHFFCSLPVPYGFHSNEGKERNSLCSLHFISTPSVLFSFFVLLLPLSRSSEGFLVSKKCLLSFSLFCLRLFFFLMFSPL